MRELNGPWKLKRDGNEPHSEEIIDANGNEVCEVSYAYEGCFEKANAIAQLPRLVERLKETQTHLNEIITMIAKGYDHVGADKTENIYELNKQLLAEIGVDNG